MFTKRDITRAQVAMGSQQAGNNLIGLVQYKGGFACGSSGQVLANSSSGPFTFVKDSGGTAGTYRAYPTVQNKSTIASIDYINCSGTTPRSPSAAETTIAQVCGWNIDTANNQWYITIQQADFTGALQSALPAKYVIAVECAVTFTPSSNPL